LKSKIFFGLIVIFLQCRSPQSFSYIPRESPEPKVKLEKRIGILPFKDLRPEKHEYRIVFLYIIFPLILWQTFDEERPSKYDSNYKFHFNEDLRRALRSELESNRQFSEVYLTEKAMPENYDLKIETEIFSTKEKITGTAYGLGIFIIPFTYLGIPIANVENEINLNLKILETKSNKLLFQKEYTNKANRYQSRYNSEKFQNEIEIVQKMFPEISNDIVNAIANK
jgi:hypothetical protein